MFYGMRRDGVLYAMCSFSHNTCERQCADRAGGDRRIRDKYSPGSHHWSNFLVLSLHIGIKSFASVWYLVDLTATPSDVIYCIAVPMPIMQWLTISLPKNRFESQFNTIHWQKAREIVVAEWYQQQRKCKCHQHSAKLPKQAIFTVIDDGTIMLKL